MGQRKRGRRVHSLQFRFGLKQQEGFTRRATARLMIDFGTPVTKIDSPRGESIVPQYALRPLQLRTKVATLKLPQMA